MKRRDDTTLAISGGAFTIAADSTLDGSLAFSNGTISGAGGLQVSDAFAWSAGDISAAVEAAGTGLISGSASKYPRGGALTVSGSTTWTDRKITVFPDSALSVPAGGVFDAAWDGTIDWSNKATGTVSVAGTLRKSAGDGAASIDAPLTRP